MCEFGELKMELESSLQSPNLANIWDNVSKSSSVLQITAENTCSFKDNK